MTYQPRYTPRPREEQGPRVLPTYEHEREDLKNRLNRQLRRLRSAVPAERTFEPKSLSRKYTTEMAYMLHEIELGPVFFAPVVIRKANDLISELESQIAKLEAGRS